MIIIDDIEQGTDSWFRCKAGVASASRSAEFSMEPKLAPMPDKITYEKVQYTNTVDTQHDLIPQDLLLTWSLKFDVNVDGHGLKRLPIFQADAPLTLTEGDILTFHWTVLRALN